MAAQQVVRKQRSAHNNGFEEFGYKNLQPTVNFDFNQAWIFLEHTLNLIFDGEISVLQCEQVHGAIYRCVIHKKGLNLYEKLKEYIRQQMIQHLSEINEAPTTNTLINNEFQQYKSKFIRLSEYFSYFDRTYICEQGLHTIYNLGLQQFREIICPELGVTDKGQIVENVLDIIQKERNGEIVDTSDLKFFIQMLNELDIESNQFYNEIFENQFLEISTDYYRNESKHLSSMTTLNYINLIDKRLDQEQIRCDSCLNAETAQKILNIVINQMIFQKGQQHNSIHQNINILLGSERGALKMLFDDNYEGIAHLYRVFSAVSLRTNQLVQTFSRFIEEECNRINNIDINDIEIEDDNVNIKVEESSAAFVEQFIQLKKKIERFLVQSFTSTSEEQDESTTSRIHDHKPDIQFEHAAIQALQRGINKNTSSAKYITQYIDIILRQIKNQNCQNINQSNLDEYQQIQQNVIFVINDCLSLFDLLNEKDQFEGHFRVLFARRILFIKQYMNLSLDQLKEPIYELNSSIILQLEYYIIIQLKQLCGQQYTAKLEGMFEDVAKAEQNIEQFNSFIQNKIRIQDNHNQINIFPLIITKTFWPYKNMPSIILPAKVDEKVEQIKPKPQCNLPHELNQVINLFEEFYKDIYRGRSLNWQSSLGIGLIRAYYQNNMYIDLTYNDASSNQINQNNQIIVDMDVSTYQICVLMLFNNRDNISYQSIKDATQIEDEILEDILASLVNHSQYPILLCNRNSSHQNDISSNILISHSDTFMYNNNFATYLFKSQQLEQEDKTLPESDQISDLNRNHFHINLISLIHGQPVQISGIGDKQLNRNVEDDRAQVVDALIVHIMKQQKELEINSLFSEISTKLKGKFIPSQRLMMLRIESLLERDYIERDPDDKQIIRICL